jgi:hypothetical protein
VDARLSRDRIGFPEMIEGRNIIGCYMPMKEMLRYKGLLILEGNDVASGVKWAMYSQSVVLMPRPTHTSWAMEEVLEPWVHYNPVHTNLTDIEEKTQWIIDNDKAAQKPAQKISERARMGIHDLFDTIRMLKRTKNSCRKRFCGDTAPSSRKRQGNESQSFKYDDNKLYLNHTYT